MHIEDSLVLHGEVQNDEDCERHVDVLRYICVDEIEQEELKMGYQRVEGSFSLLSFAITDIYTSKR